MKDTDYAPSRNILYEHMSKIKRGENMLSHDKHSGGHPKLMEEDWNIICGWILCQGSIPKLETVVKWIMVNFDVSLNKSTISRHLKEMGLSFQLASSRSTKSNSPKDYAKGYYDFIMELRELEFFNYDKRKIICLDFGKNSYRLDRKKVIGIVGGKQPKLKLDSPKYTNSYFIPATMAAGLELKAIMFTLDPKFNRNGPGWKDVIEWCYELQLDSDQIVYEESKKVYCGENNKQMSHFIQVNRENLKVQGFYMMLEIHSN